VQGSVRKFDVDWFVKFKIANVPLKECLLRKLLLGLGDHGGICIHPYDMDLFSGRIS
jgi:hypothetical protein